MPQVIAHPVYGEVAFPDDFDNKQIFEAFQNLDKMGKQGAAKAPAPKQAAPSTALDVASDIAIEGGISTAGQLAGAATGPGYFVIAPASGVYGNYLKQQQQIARGEKKDLSYGELVAAGLINLLPGVSAGKALALGGINLAAKSTAAKVGYTAGLRAAEGAGLAVGAKTIEEYIDTGSFPTIDEYLSAAASGGILGGAVGGAEAGIALGFPKLSKNASKMWNTLAGKKASDVGQALDDLATNGSPEQKAAASEIIDEVGQRLGIVRPPTGKGAQQSARDMLGYEYIPTEGTRPASEAAQAFGQLTPTESERQLIEMGLKQAAPAPSAMESAAAMGILPVKPAREAADVLAQAPLTPDEQAARFVPALEPKSAMESASAMGVLPVRPARAAAEILAQAPLTPDEQTSRFVASFQPKSAAESAAALQFAGTYPSKSAAEAAAVLANAPLTPAEQAARFVASFEPKSAQESAQALQFAGTYPTKSAAEAAAVLSNAPLTPAEQAARFVASFQTKSAAESAEALRFAGGYPAKSAQEAADVLAQAPLTLEEKAARIVASLEPKSAKEAAEILGQGQPIKSAKESAEILAAAAKPKKTQIPTDDELEAAAFTQRDAPEGQMEKSVSALQSKGGPAIYNDALEDIGDLAHRFQETGMKGSTGLAGKLPKWNRGLPNFEEQIKIGLDTNATYRVVQKYKLEVEGEPMWKAFDRARAQYPDEIKANIAAAKKEMVKQGKLYADAHRKYNKPVTYAAKLGRDAAIALGEMDFDKLRKLVAEMKDIWEKHSGTPEFYSRTKPKDKKTKSDNEPIQIAVGAPDAVLPLAALAAGEAAENGEGTTPAERAVYAALAVGAAAVAGRKLYKKALSRVEAKANTFEEAMAARAGIQPITVGKGQATVLPSDINPNVQRTLKELNIPSAEKPKTLEDVDRLFGEAKEDSKFLTIGDRAAELFQNSFRPLAVLEQKIRGSSPKLNLADKFSLIGGAGGKAEPAIAEMEQVRRTLVGDIHPKDINRYFALNRASDRLQRGIVTGGLSIDDTQRLLTDLRKGLGQEKIDRLDKFAQYMQQSADADLQLMVSSGRISQKLYDDIKAANDFYAPFHFTNKIGELDLMSQRSRSGQPIDTQAELAKELVGLNDKDLKLGDIFTAFKRNKYNAHILAEKSAAMKELVEVAMMDKDGVYAKFVKSPQAAPRNMETVAYLDGGKTKYIAVDPSVARAVSGLSPIELGVAGKMLQIGSLGLRTGATFLNAAWLSKSLPIDFLRQMTMSKYGIREPKDLLPWTGYTLDIIESFGSAIQAHAPGRFKNITPLYKQYLDSGAARSTFASVINEDAFTKAVMRGDDGTIAKLIDVADKYILSTPGKFANALEDTIKLMGLKRGMRFENVDKLTPEARAKMMQEIAYEVRNYAGSPDFAKFGSLGRQANLISMFANARGQGVAADFARLTGRTGTKEARDAWLRIGITFGGSAAALWAVNHTPENVEDYTKLSERDKVNFFNIPLYDENGPKYNTDKYGRKVRDYLRIPKRDVSALMSNSLDKALDFYGEQNPEAVYEWANAMADAISPVSISGRNLSERGMSVISSLNPVLKVPIEQITNVNLFRKTPLVGRDLQELSPQYQYEESTPEIYKNIAQAVPGISPIRLQSAVEGMTGGAFSQFVKKPQEGRNELASNPLLSSYFRSGTLDESAAFDRIDKLRTQQSDRAFIREMEINKALEAALALPKEQRQAAMRASLPANVVADPAFGDTLVRLIVDNRLKVTPVERRTRTLQPSERAQYIYETMVGLKTDDQKRAYINRQLTIPGMVTDDVAVYLKRWQKSNR